MSKTVRWKERFQNLSDACRQMEKALKRPNLSDLERAGLIQFFELAFELSWKTLKDYLESEGINATTPRETLKLAFQNNLIEEGHLWIEALKDRNLTVHTYEEAIAVQVEKLIREKYAPLIIALKEKLSQLK